MITHPLRSTMFGRVALHCDGLACKPRRRFLSRNWSARKAREHAARYGWRSGNGFDLCEGCSVPEPSVYRRAS
jgi:hypothetical protein